MRPDSLSGPHDYDRIVQDLTYKYDGVFSKESVAQAVADARRALEPASKIPTFLPILAARLRQPAADGRRPGRGTDHQEVPELLFVCVHNAGRSQMAAALAEHLSGGPRPRPLRRLRPRRGGQPGVDPGPRRTRHHPGRAVPEAVVRQRRPRRRRDHHDGLRRRLPHLPRQTLRGLGRAPTPPTSQSRRSETSATTSKPASPPCCATSSTDQPRRPN